MPQSPIPRETLNEPDVLGYAKTEPLILHIAPSPLGRLFLRGLHHLSIFADRDTRSLVRYFVQGG